MFQLNRNVWTGLAALSVAAGLCVAMWGASSDAVRAADVHDVPATAPSATADPKSLYERLGGEPAITAIVDDFVARFAADAAVNFTRVGHPNHWEPTPDNVALLKKHLVQFIEKAAGGPQKYEGRKTADVHKGMEITEAEWKAIIEDFVTTLKKFNVPDKEQAELLAAVASTHDQIVGK